MFATRRAIFVVPRQLPCRAATSRTFSHTARCCDAETTQLASSSTKTTTEGVSEPKTPSATRSKTAASTSAASKWTRAKQTKAAASPAAAAASTITATGGSKTSSAAQRSHTSYQARTIAHQAQSRDAEPTTEAPFIDWATSFHGISTKPVTAEQFEVLMQPIDEKDIEVKPDGVIYLPEIKYRRRLNEAFGPMGWGMIPKGEAVVGDAIVTREYALIVDGRFVSQAQGENSYFSPEQLPSAVEGCKSNALMRCCKDLGIGSDLWDPHFVRSFKKNHMEEVWVEHATTKKKRTFWYRKGDVEVAYPYKLAK